MNLKSILSSVATPETLQKIADATGQSPDTVQQIVHSGLPLMVGQMAQNTTSQSGESSLNSALDQHNGGIMDALSGLFGGSNGASNDGLSILGHIFGGSSDTAANHVAKKTGVDAGTVMKVLSFVAPLVLAYLAQHRSQGGNVAKSTQTATDQSGNPLINIVGSILGGGDKSNNGGIFGSILGGLLGKK